MCGIAGLFIKDPKIIRSHEGLELFVDHMFLGIENRGRQASGFVAVTDTGEVKLDKNDSTASEFIKIRDPLPNNTQIAMLHTRFATKGSVEEYCNNHPVVHHSCLTVHNGTVDNDDELFEQHKFERFAEVDSEIIPALIYKAGFDPDKIAELFKDVRGSVASATIDPINYPGKVLLLRTKNSPLYLFDTEKFFIWASDTNTLRSAWGKVLGTPPKWDKFLTLAEYNFAIIGNGGIESVHKLEKPVEPVVVPSTSYQHQGKAWNVPKNQTPKRTFRAPYTDDRAVDISIAPTDADIKIAVTSMRKEGLGQTTLFADALGAPNATQVTWTHCRVCQQTVLDTDMHTTLMRGRMCTDCKEMYTNLYRYKADQEEKKETKGTDKWPSLSINEYLSPETIKDANTWAESEEEVHSLVMEYLAELTGISTEMLNFLMFRMDPNQVSDNEKIADLLDQLWAEYEAEYLEYWNTEQEAEIAGYIHVLAPHTAKKEPVVKVVPPQEPLFKNGNMPKRQTRCLFCRKSPFMYIEGAGEDTVLNYCNNHWNKCSVNGCNSQANHTRKDGMRLCHTHSRSVKECYTDAVLKQYGYESRLA